MKTTTLVVLLLGSWAGVAAGGYAAAAAATPRQHVAVKPESVETKGPAPDDGKWHFAGEPAARSEVRRPVIEAPVSHAVVARPVHPAVPPAVLAKPVLPSAGHEPLTQNENSKTAGVSLPVRPPAVVAHRGPSFNDVPHRGPNPAVIVGVRSNAKNADTGALNGTAFHRKP